MYEGTMTVASVGYDGPDTYVFRIGLSHGTRVVIINQKDRTYPGDWFTCDVSHLENKAKEAPVFDVAFQIHRFGVYHLPWNVEQPFKPYPWYLLRLPWPISLCPDLTW